MATDTIVGNRTFPIYNPDGSSFHGLELKKSVYESVVMSLGDKVTGDVYYPTNALTVTMKEYIVHNGVKFVLVNPPVVVKEGLVSDNGELKGMTKYSFTFYHPMYMLGNFPLCDVAVSSDQQRYLSENKTFFWIGNLTDFVAKLNKNLENTEWYCVINDSVSQADRQRLSEVMSFDKNTIADALKTGYETWDIPYIITAITDTSALYTQGKRFLIQFGLPTTEILVENEQHENVPFVFHFGQGVGLKNNSRNPRNNKIVTRIAGFGSEDNIQYGYPQIPYTGGTCQYPLYYGIVGGQRVQLIKHPFTRTHLMPSIYRDTVNKKVNPMASGYDPNIELKDYYDADNTYENPIKPLEQSYEIHEFEDIKPELGHRTITGVHAYETKDLSATPLSSFLAILRGYYTESEYLKEKEELEKIINTITTLSSNSGSVNTRAYYCDWSFTKDERYAYVKYESSALNFNYTVLMVNPSQEIAWDDTMDDDGNYVQSYFRITIPQLSFDLYASAAITQEMTINMRSGACLGCSFPVMVDWDDYKLNFYDSEGNFAPNGSQRDFTKYPDSSQGQISLILQKETSTFGTLMPNIYQKPNTGDEFVVLGISLPTTYITEAEERLDAEMKQYMRDNNVYYFDYPLKFDEYFLTTHAGILSQMDNNVVVRFDYAGSEYHLYIKQISIKYDNKPLPTYDITLTDNIEVVLNQIGQVVDEVRRLHDTMGGISIEGNDNYIRKDIDDTAYGTVSFVKGLQVGNRFVTGLLGEGGVFRKDEDGTTYLECDKLYVRMRAYFDTVEVRHYLHSTGNRIASMAGINCSRVEYIKANGDVTQDASEAVLFRCYFRANDDGREVRNDFVVGDLAFCKETNANTDSIEQHGYWRAVVGRNVNGTLTDDGEGWIDLSASDCQQGSGIPIAQDDIIQLGNKTDVTRQGAIVEFVSGDDAPSYQIFQGINDYNLNNKNYISLGYSSSTGRAYMNVFGDAFIGEAPDSQGNSSTYIHYYQKEETDPETGQTVVTPTMDIKANVIFQNPDTGEDTSLIDYINDVVGGIQEQIDKKAETWYQDTDPSLSWADNSEHVGDLWYCTSHSDSNHGFGTTWRFSVRDNGEGANPRYTYFWEQMNVPEEVFDKIDGKAEIYVTKPTTYNERDLWIIEQSSATCPDSDIPANCQRGDIVVSSASRVNNYQKSDWTKKDRYTDDSKFDGYINAFLNGTGSSGDAATAAAAQKAIKDALGGATVVDGGLMLTSLIAMRKYNGGDKTQLSSYTTWAGISGQYDANAYGGGIAAWYGGLQADKEVSATNYAKTVFRFDGSGYVAGGNLKWDSSGNVTIQGYDIKVNGESVAVGNLNDYVTIATDQTITGHKTFGTGNGSYIQIGAIRLVYDQSNNALKVVASDGSSVANFYATGGVSALGIGSGGSSGGISIDAVWTALANTDSSKQINISHLTNALSGYNPTNNFKTINGNSIIGTGNITIEGGSGGVDMTAVWQALAANTTEQINATHLTTALSNKTVTASTLDSLAGSFTFEGYNLTIDVTPQIDEVGIQIGSTVDKFQLVCRDYALMIRQNDEGGTDYRNWTKWITLPTKLHTSHQLTKRDQWFRFANLTRYGASYLVSIRDNYYNDSPTPVTWIINVGYDSATITQVGRAVLSPTSLTKLRIVRYDNDGDYGFRLEVYTPYQNYISQNTPEINIMNLGCENMSDGIELVYDPDYDTKWLEVNETIESGELLIQEVGISDATSLWGQPFDGSSSVSGSMTGVTSIEMNSDGALSSFGGFIDFHYGGSSADYTSRIIENASGRIAINDILYVKTNGTVGIGTDSPSTSYKLDVNGDGRVYNLIIGSDSDNVKGKIAPVTFSGTGQGFKLVPDLTNTDVWFAYRRSVTSTSQPMLYLYASIENSGINALQINKADSTTYNFHVGQGFASKAGATILWGYRIDFKSRLNGTGSSLTYMSITNDGNIGIGTTSPSYKLQVNGQSYFTGNMGIGVAVSNSYALRVNGIVRASTGVYSEGYVTALSDIRHKDIRGDVWLTVSEVANAPAVKFLWKDRRQEGLQVGSIAQYWQKVLPEAIMEAADGELTMSYGVIALLASIATARKVEDHERRIAELEKENKELKEQLKA